MSKVNKSQKVRDYIATNPDDPVRTIANKLGVSSALVHQVRYQEARKSRKNGHRTVASAQGNGHGNVLAAAKLLAACGGDIEAARSALTTVSQVAAALHD